ncbi:outer membrane beta-barrel protein [Roseomonas chloroacetimidivorans]|uniref:outer membrane beta-barrel protein n=1 Tax=Roseomonas chloroacetimidivorans TaxID=1766656 RepID=UPI003C73D3FD
MGPNAVARGTTVTSRSRPDYDPLGVRLGGFRLHGSAEAGVGFSDDVAPNTMPGRSDGFVDNAFRLDLNSDWTRQALGITASQAARQHIRSNDLNWNDFGVGFAGRYDIGRASSVGFEYGHVRNHLDVTSFDVEQGSLTRPIPYDSDRVRLTGTAGLNRVAIRNAVEYSIIRYDEEERTAFGTIGSGRDHNRLLGETEMAYSFVPGRAVTLTTRLTDINYRRSDRRGQDSFTWEVLGGVRYDLTGLWEVRFAAGYRHRDYQDPTLRSLSGPAFEGQITYLPSQLTTFTLAAQRTIEESIRADATSYTRTQIRFAVDHELRRNIILSGELRAERLEYQSPSEKVTDAAGMIGLQFLINRNWSVWASYQRYERLEAPASTREFDQNVLQLRMKFAL